MRTAAICAATALALVACSSGRLEAPDCEGQPEASYGAAPDVEDDGYTTYLRFPGRLRIPAVTAIGQDGREAAVRTTEDPERGEVRVHGVYPAIVLRDGSRVACLKNMAFDPVGRRPAR